MSKRFFAVAFAIGLLTVGWVALGFVGTHTLALAMTGVIAGVYLLGAWELRQFRVATAQLLAAVQQGQPVAALEPWLERVPASLRPAVRGRVEGQARMLPGPALTPYLVGLLVMLGMLGTFLGMVVTFKGAVFALEGSADLQAMRGALAEPIKGLGLSFGTSVAGVAASAMLGLMSALSRRERLEVVRQLDACVATVLRPFSMVHQREASLQALQAQAGVLPQVAAQLEAMMARIEARSQQLDEHLLARQERFQREAQEAYGKLAASVGQSLEQSLAAGARAAGESITPVVAGAMAQVVAESQRLQARLGEAAQAQVDGLSQRFAASAQAVSQTWTAALDAHERSSQAVAQQLQQALASFSQTFEQRSAGLLAQVQERLAQAQAQQAEGEAQRLAVWTQSLQALTADLQAQWQHAAGQAMAQQEAVASFSQTLEQRSADLLAQVQERFAQAQAQQAEGEAQRLDVWTQALQALAADVQAQWQRAAEQATAQQQALGRTLEQATGEIAERASAQAGRTMDEAAQLLSRSEALVRSRVDTEAQWHQQQGERMDALARLWREELHALRQDESQRGQAAVERLGALEAAVAQHLATLGASLEAPLSRLLQTASEVPQAAAGVITQLREEMSRMAERDNVALEDRTALLAQLATLVQSVNQATGEQRQAIEALVASAGAVMQEAGQRFAQTLAEQADQTRENTSSLAASAVDLASVGEAFGQGVQQFQASSDQLLDGLQRIEMALSRSTSRSDEQLAYYVAQAREVIDLSISSQQGILESLQQLKHPPVQVIAAGDLA